jgi:DNA (cytosine-5)-methyltransferase 1
MFSAHSAAKNKRLKIGSLFSGTGALDLAVMDIFEADVAWHCEIEEAPSKILDIHWPGVPNYKDVTQVDFTNIEQVDILTGGFPCQDLSIAGSRKGLSDGTRSNLWFQFHRAVSELKPKIVVIENVRGLLSAKANSDLELRTSSLEYKAGEPTLRAMGAVAGSLAEIGYDCRWTTVRASDIGAPHQRERVFIIAYPSNSNTRTPA